MEGAIFFYTKYGSTRQYAQWIAEATGLPIFDVDDKSIDPANYDFLVLGSPVLYYKLAIRKWVKRHMVQIKDKPIIFFTVSGAPAGKKLDRWIGDSLPEQLVSRMHHVALQGRQIPGELTLFDRFMLIIGAMFNKDPEATKEELEGFDYMNKGSIAPIVDLVRQLHSSEVVS